MINKKAVLFIFLLAGSFAFFTAGSEAVRKKAHVQVMTCVGCGDCIRVCPVKVITMKRGKADVYAEKCIGCSICKSVCAYGAIKCYKNQY